MLIGRIRKIDHDIDTRLKAGEKLSPAIRSTLETIRKKAGTAASTEQRRQVATELDSWERLFLPRR
jgi:serine/threonine-protein kinase